MGPGWAEAARTGGIVVGVAFAMYGLAKLTGHQARPAYLMTPADLIPSDKLVWYFLGRERSYIWSLGVVELLAGVLTLVRGTRVVGASACLMLAVHITILDFSFGLLPVAFVALALTVLAAFALLADWSVLRHMMWVPRTHRPGIHVSLDAGGRQSLPPAGAGMSRDDVNEAEGG